MNDNNDSDDLLEELGLNLDKLEKCQPKTLKRKTSKQKAPKQYGFQLAMIASGPASNGKGHKAGERVTINTQVRQWVVPDSFYAIGHDPLTNTTTLDGFILHSVRVSSGRGTPETECLLEKTPRLEKNTLKYDLDPTPRGITMVAEVEFLKDISFYGTLMVNTLPGAY